MQKSSPIIQTTYNRQYNLIERSSPKSEASDYKTLKIDLRNISSNMSNNKNLQQLQTAHPTHQLSQIMQTKHIKNDEFLFRMKLKLIACLQQLEIQKQIIEQLRKQQTDTQVLQYFTSQVKKQFHQLKKYKEECILKKQGGDQKYSLLGMGKQAIQKISLQNQLGQTVESEKRFKQKCQKLFTQNTELLQKLKQKQYQLEDLTNQHYESKLQIKQLEAALESLKQKIKKYEKQFMKQKQKFVQQVNALRSLLTKQKQNKQTYNTKMQDFHFQSFEKDNQIKRLKEQIQFIKKQNIKWKSRSQWKQKQSIDELKQYKQNIRILQNEVQNLNIRIKRYQQQMSTEQKLQIERDLYNKKLENIVEQWKLKLIQNVEEYQTIIEENINKINETENIIANLQVRIQRQQKDKQKIMQQKSKQVQGFRVQISSLQGLIETLKQQSQQHIRTIDQKSRSIHILQGSMKTDKQTFVDISAQLGAKQQKIQQLQRGLKSVEQNYIQRLITFEKQKKSEISAITTHFNNILHDKDRLIYEQTSKNDILNSQNLRIIDEIDIVKKKLIINEEELIKFKTKENTIIGSTVANYNNAIYQRLTPNSSKIQRVYVRPQGLQSDNSSPKTIRISSNQREFN